MNMNSALPFTVPFGRYSLVGDILSNDSIADVVILHGAGESCRHRFYSIGYLAERPRMFLEVTGKMMDIFDNR